LLAQRPVFRAAFGAVLSLPQPVIAAVHGYALGGGCELALCCDLIVADETAVFGLPEVTVGLVPGGGGTQLALRRLGPGRAARPGPDRPPGRAAEAERLGLASTGGCRPAPRASTRWRWPDRSRPTRPLPCWPPSGPSGRARASSLAVGLEVEDAAWRAAAFSGDRRLRREAPGHRGVQGEAGAAMARRVATRTEAGRE
jgi:enoyl-CoA hydratase/carnithine racemase